jgi:hypothetical protein
MQPRRHPSLYSPPPELQIILNIKNSLIAKNYLGLFFEKEQVTDHDFYKQKRKYRFYNSL